MVVHGSVAEDNDFQKVTNTCTHLAVQLQIWLPRFADAVGQTLLFLQEKENPYEVPNSMGILKLLESPLEITTSTIIKRIVSNHDAYQVFNHLVL